MWSHNIIEDKYLYCEMEIINSRVDSIRQAAVFIFHPQKSFQCPVSFQ